jgi:hypothetical protein
MPSAEAEESVVKPASSLRAKPELVLFEARGGKLIFVRDEG